MTVDCKMNIRNALEKFLSSLKINFTILPTAKIFATSEFTSKSIEIIRYFAGYFLYTATPLVVIAAVAFSNSSSDLKKLKDKKSCRKLRFIYKFNTRFVKQLLVLFCVLT